MPGKGCTPINTPNGENWRSAAAADRTGGLQPHTHTPTRPYSYLSWLRAVYSGRTALRAGRSIVQLAILLLFYQGTAAAAVLRVGPPLPQPGDVLTLTIYPVGGEELKAAAMAAFDTPYVKFYARQDGSLRAFLGFPFDRPGGAYPLKARVRVSQGATTGEQVLRVTMQARVRHFPTQYIRMSPAEARKMVDKASLRAERKLVQSTMQDSPPAPLWTGSWLVPTQGHSTSSYGRRRYINGKWWGQHNGADIKAPTGAPVAASNSGRVVLSQYLPTLRGNCIVIDHGCNVFSIYMHLSQRLVEPGAGVEKGELVGRVGRTGFVTGPHLHWEIRIGWEPVDPFQVARRGLEF